MDEEILLLANSTKDGGRCLAGVRPDGSWVRPVSGPGGGEIPVGVTLFGGRPLRPLDVIGFKTSAYSPLPYQAEDWVVDPSTITLVDTRALNDVDVLLNRVSATTPRFLQSATEAVMAAEIAASEENWDSLGLIAVDDVRLVRGPNQVRAYFEFGGQKWNLVFTDNNGHELEPNTSREVGPSYLCVSLAKPFSPFGNELRHYKVVAGLIPRNR